MKKIILFVLCSSLNVCYGWLHLESFETCLKNHGEAFKVFEPEASHIKVECDVNYSTHRITTKYTPNTPNLLKYLSAYKNLNNKLYYKAIFKGILLGLPIGFLSALNVEFNKKLDRKSFWFPAFASILGSAGTVLQENGSIDKPVPYFDPYTLIKYNNFFSNRDLNTIKRMFYGASANLTTNFLSFLIFWGLTNSIKNRIDG